MKQFRPKNIWREALGEWKIKNGIEKHKKLQYCPLTKYQNCSYKWTRCWHQYFRFTIPLEIQPYLVNEKIPGVCNFDAANNSNLLQSMLTVIFFCENLSRCWFSSSIMPNMSSENPFFAKFLLEQQYIMESYRMIIKQVKISAILKQKWCKTALLLTLRPPSELKKA